MNVLLLCLCGCESVFNVAEIEQRLWCLEFLGVQIYSLYILLPRCLFSLRRLFFRCLLCPAVPVCLFDLCSRGVNSTESLREDGWRGWGSVKERESDWVWVSLACSGPLLCRMNDGRGQEISDTSESKVEWKPYWGVNLVFSVLRYKYLKVRQSGITEDQCPPPINTITAIALNLHWTAVPTKHVFSSNKGLLHSVTKLKILKLNWKKSSCCNSCYFQVQGVLSSKRNCFCLEKHRQHSVNESLYSQQEVTFIIALLEKPLSFLLLMHCCCLTCVYTPLLNATGSDLCG